MYDMICMVREEEILCLPDIRTTNFHWCAFELSSNRRGCYGMSPSIARNRCFLHIEVYDQFLHR